MSQTQTKETNKETLNKTTKQLLKLKRDHFYYGYQPEFTTQIALFAKTHQHEERKIFQKAWIQWKEEHQDLVVNEIRHLTELNYQGDILDKMYKSARFYYRKKPTDKKEHIRATYTKKPKELLQAIDEHLKTSLHLKPQMAFESFLEEYTNSISNLLSNYDKDDMKNTYKNRYYSSLKKCEKTIY